MKGYRKKQVLQTASIYTRMKCYSLIFLSSFVLLSIYWINRSTSHHATSRLSHIIDFNQIFIRFNAPTNIFSIEEILAKMDTNNSNKNPHENPTVVNRKPILISTRSSYHSKINSQSPRQAVIPIIDNKIGSTSGTNSIDVQICPNSLVQKLQIPALSKENVSFCKWSLDSSPSGGHLIVGKSWGKLTKPQQAQYQLLGCNLLSEVDTVSPGSSSNRIQGDTGRSRDLYNPSCDDSWGDSFILNWRHQNSITQEIYCDKNKNTLRTGPTMLCHTNRDKENHCELRNAAIHFSRMKTIHKSSNTLSRAFEPDFITVNCPSGSNTINLKVQNESKFNINIEKYFPFPKLLNLTADSGADSGKCDLRISGSTVVFTHDNIKNLCHTIQDLMNIWLTLWLTSSDLFSSARYSSNLNFLSIDAMRLYNNFNDLLLGYRDIYNHLFKNVYTANDFKGKTVCFDHLIFQPLSPKGFVWDNWERDLPCSYVGPSSLFQRYNLHLRHLFGHFYYDSEQFSSKIEKLSLHDNYKQTYTSNEIQVLLVIRTEKGNDWGNIRTSRIIKNIDEVVQKLTQLFTSIETKLRAKAYTKDFKFNFIQIDMSKLSIPEQIELISKTKLIIGIHGAGLAASMHMPIGSKNCCGLMEITPKGEFSPARGYGNMARKLGLYHRRMDLDSQHSHSDGAVIPINELMVNVRGIVESMVQLPTCVLPQVLSDPFLERL